MATDDIEEYLAAHNYIAIRVSKEELEQGITGRYFDLLTFVGQHKKYAGKFCGEFALEFAGFTPQEIWQGKETRSFVRRLNAEFPFMFYLSEKQGETLKLLTILECSDGKLQGDNMALNQEKFEKYLKTQLEGLINTCQWVGYSPEDAQIMVEQVYKYFGI